MDALQTAFTTFFLILYSFFYPFFKNPVLATYVFILILIVFAAVKFYKIVRSRSLKDQGIKSKLLFLISLIIELFLILMIIWYVFIHFNSYKLM